MYTPLISVIIPIYKVESYLKRCIDSILEQTYRNLEIILVDDGSPDNCPIICDEYQLKDSRIRLIHKTNGGMSSARNAGLDTATGAFIIFVDSDDFIHSLCIEKLYILSVNNDADIVQCDFQKGDENYFAESISNIRITKYDNQEIFHSHKFKIPVWGKLYKTSLWKNIRMPLSKTYEDDFTTWKLAYNSTATVITNEKLYYYYMKPDSIMRNDSDYIMIDFIDAYNERIQFFKENDKLDLVELSAELFCISLMLTYNRCKKNPHNTNDQHELFRLYKENFQTIKNSKYISLKRKMIFRLFNQFPNSISSIVNYLHFR